LEVIQHEADFLSLPFAVLGVHSQVQNHSLCLMMLEIAGSAASL
jgi:hypothetical protein